MDPRDLVGRTLDTGREVTQRSQERLESLVGQLQRLSEEQLDQVAVLVGELRDRSLLSGEQIAGFVDRRVRAQLAALGIATRADLDRVEARLERLDETADASVHPGSDRSRQEGKQGGKAKSKGAKSKGAKSKDAKSKDAKSKGAKAATGKSASSTGGSVTRQKAGPAAGPAVGG